MQLTFLGQTGHRVETKRATTLMDTWKLAAKAFDSMWFHFPRKQDLTAQNNQSLERIGSSC